MTSTARARTRAPNREADGRQDLVVVESGGEGALEEVRRGDVTTAARAGRFQRRIEGERYRRQLGGGVGVCDRAADRAPIPDLEMTDVGQREREQRHGPAQFRISFGVCLTNHRANPSGIRSDLDPSELVDLAEVDQPVELRQPQRQHGDQALATGERLDGVAARRQSGDRLVECGRGLVVERCRLHTSSLRSLGLGESVN